MLYYSPGADKTYSSNQLLALFGIDDSKAGIEAINFSGLYPVQESTPDVDRNLYNLVVSWVIVALTPSGEGAKKVWTGTPKALATAQAAGSTSVKQHSQQVISGLETSTGYSMGMMSGVASLSPAERPARFETLLTDVANHAEVLDAQLTYIENATTVDEVNAAVNPPSVSGSVDLARTGNDLDDSFVTAITGVSADDLSLYFPSTGTTVAYDNATSKFPATVGVFSGGDYTGVIKYLGIFRLATFDLSTSPATVAISWQYQS